MNIDKLRWGSDDINEENEDEIYSVIEESIYSPLKAPPLVELKRSQSDGYFNRNSMRESLVGFKDGIPGIFSGLKENKLRSSIKAKQPFYGDDDNYMKLTDIPKVPEEDCIYHEVVPDEELNPLDFSSHFKPRFSIKNQHVIVETGLGNHHVETGMRFYDPTTDTACRPSSSFLVPLSNEENVSDSSWDSDFEQSIEQSSIVIPADEEIYEVIGTPRSSLKGGAHFQTPEGRRKAALKIANKQFTIEPEYANIDYDNVKKKIVKLPHLPPRNSIVYYSEDDKETYFEVELKEEENPVKLPPLKNDSTEYQIKRYQLIKCIMETEYAYMKSLRRLVKEYEEPLLENEIINQDCVKVIFKHVHEIMQCHQLFNMALSYRANEWEKSEVIGDVILASFSKAMVFKAYCNFVCSFSLTMDSIKETCKLVPAFLNFLKNKEHDQKAKQSLYHLMGQPLQYIPNLVLLTETLLKETPFPHDDRLPLQMALTHLECLCETLANERMNIIMKEKVKELDGQLIGLEKELASSTRYFIRHDDMLLCETENGNLVKTKPHRIFMLNDLILCASYLSKRQQMQLMTNKLYKVKWCHPISDVHIVDVTSGIYINTDARKGCSENSFQIFKGQHPSAYMEDLLHDLTIFGDVMGKVSSLRLSYPFIDSNKVNEWYKDIHKKLDSVMEMANMNWVEMSLPSSNTKGEREEWLFNVSSPRKKLEWRMEFENINLLLTGDNNPGWYLQEENEYEHEVVNLRRALPLVASIQPLFMVNPETSVQCVLDATAMTASKPILWIFSGNEKLGVITLMEMNMLSVLHVLHSYIACNERICCAEIVMKKEDESKTEECAYVWIGTMSGRILIYNALDVNERQPIATASLDDSIVSMKYTRNMVFVGLADGNLLRFTVSAGPTWDITNPMIVSLSMSPIMSIVESCERLWCASGSSIYVVNIDKMIVEEEVATCENRKGTIKQLISYGIGVWVSLRKSSILLLYHGETKEQLQMINTTTPITRMKNEIEGPIREICIENIYVTTLLAKEGLLWVGVDQGLIVTYPLPKLGGIPIVSGKACVSFHAHGDTVKHIHAFSLQRFFQCESDDLEGDVEKETPAMNATKSTDPCNGATKHEVKENDPVYFILEQESEPVTETSSISLTDDDEEKPRIEDIVMPDEHKEEMDDENEVTKHKGQIQITSENNGKEVGHNEHEAGNATKQITISNVESVANKDKVDGDGNKSPTQDFCFIEDFFQVKDFTDTPVRTLSVKSNNEERPVDNFTRSMSFLQNDGFASMMESFDGFNESSTQSTHTNLNSKHIGINEVDDILPTSKEGNSSEETNANPVKGDVPLTFYTPRALRKQKNDENIISTALETTEKKGIEEERTKNDIPPKAEIPQTFPTRRRTKRQNVVRSVNIPVSTNDPIANPECTTGKTTDPCIEKKKDIPSSFFVQGESFSAYDVKHQTEIDVFVSPNQKENTRTCGSNYVEKSSNNPIYEVPLKICDDMYAVLENSDSYQSTDDITASVNIAGLGRSKSDEEYKNKTLPSPCVTKNVLPQKLVKQTSFASTSGGDSSHDNHTNISPLRRKQKESRKVLTLTREEKRNDFINNSWYVLSIGSGHIDLRKATKYSENLNLLNSSSFEGREAMLLLWKMNAGNSFYR